MPLSGCLAARLPDRQMKRVNFKGKKKINGRKFSSEEKKSPQTTNKRYFGIHNSKGGNSSVVPVRHFTVVGLELVTPAPEQVDPKGRRKLWYLLQLREIGVDYSLATN